MNIDEIFEIIDNVYTEGKDINLAFNNHKVKLLDTNIKDSYIEQISKLYGSNIQFKSNDIDPNLILFTSNKKVMDVVNPNQFNYAIQVGDVSITNTESYAVLQNIVREKLFPKDMDYAARWLLNKVARAIEFSYENAKIDYNYFDDKGKPIKDEQLKKYLAQGIHPVSRIIKFDKVDFMLPVGLSIIAGSSGTGKSTFVNLINSKTGSRVIRYSEPNMFSINNPIHLGRAISEFMDNEEPVLIIDSLSSILSASGREAAGAGGIATSIFDEFTELSNLCLRKNKALICVLNFKTFDPKILEVLSGRVACYIHSIGNHIYKIYSRVSVASRQEEIVDLSSSISIFKENAQKDKSISSYYSIEIENSDNKYKNKDKNKNRKDSKLEFLSLAEYKPNINI